MITIREERPEDIGAIRFVLEQAFGQANEADLVDVLRKRQAITLSLVGLKDGKIVAHILFSPVTVESNDQSFGGIGLGPMAVLPDNQRQGIGSQLVQAGLEKCRQAGHEIVVVLGHPMFYAKFGFMPAKPLGLFCEFEVPDDVFRVIELAENVLAGRGGLVKYRPEFSTV